MENSDIKQFGRYEVLAELGRGAMGVVYKARDPQIDRMVAVKTVSLWGQEVDEENEFRLRFMHEAKAAGRLQHPGIVAIFDAGENPENNHPYIVLEYVAGEALNRILAREKKLPLPTALRLTQEIAEALDYAHAQGVIHRDIKPGNILITEEGHPKIADFGIAKLNLAHFTVPGRLLGTPAYMAPEQLSGEAADGRSDLFSLGVILYAMVTGHSPFHGDSATTVSFKVANREPLPASALDLTLPSELDEVISRAMAKDPQQRYQSGGEFAEDVCRLQQLLEQGASAASPGTATQTTSSGTRGGKTKTGTTKTGITKAGTTRAGTTNAGTAAAIEHPALLIAQAATFLRTAVLRTPVRDLILGAVTVVILVIAGFESKLFVTSRVEMNPTPAAPASTSGALPNSALTIPDPGAQTPTNAAVAQATPVAAAGQLGKGRAPSSHAARQIVVPSCNLDLAVQHQFKDATLFVWVDDKLALTRPLHGGTQKHLVVFNGIRGIDSETLKIPAGKHVLRVRALSSDETIDLSKTISSEFVGGGNKSLQVTFDKHNTVMHLNWQ
jgi:eukaryotic-like serine/threonine-protein kinase